MARTKAATRRVNLDGSLWVAADLLTPDVTNGNYADNDGATVVFLSNGASTRTLTVTSPDTVYGLAVADKVYSLTANQFEIAGPFPLETFGPQLLLDFSANDLKFLIFSLLPTVRQ
jgi:hypothetical protein